MPATCTQCGAVNQVPGSYVGERTFFLRTVFYCPACWNLRQQRSLNRAMRTQFVVLGTLIALGAALMLEPRWQPLGWVALAWPLLWVSALGLLVLHELAHALCARLLGWRVLKISLGVGRNLCSFQLAGLRFELNAFLVVGLTGIAPRSVAHFRAKYFLIVLAGPCVHILQLAFAGFWLAGYLSAPGPVPGERTLPLFVVMALNLSALVACLTPYKMTILSDGIPERIPSDGLALWTIPFLSQATAQAWHARALGAECTKLLEPG